MVINLIPRAAWELMQEQGDTWLVDVRPPGEWHYVGGPDLGANNGVRAQETRSGGIAKSANQAATILGSKSDRQNQIRLQSTRRRRTVHAGTGESASWAHDGQSPIAHINR
jgi:hypothetical protein